MDKRRRIILGLVLLSYFIVAIDGSIVITGLNRISTDLNLSHVAFSWVQNAYVLAFGGFMLMGGSMSDTFGRKRMFNISLVLFGIGSLGSGIAQSAAFIIVSRFIQGAGSAIMAPCSLALIMDYFEGKERVKAVAWYGSISGLGLCIGLILGGAITDYISWRAGFLVNIPIICVMITLSIKNLDGKDITNARFDVIGTILSVSGIFCLVYAIDGADNITIWFIAGIVLLAVFVSCERNNTIAIMPLRLFNNADRRNAYISRMLLIGAMMGFNLFISEFMQETFRYTPLMTGIGFLPMNIATFTCAMKVPSAVNKYGNYKVLITGLTLLTIGFSGMLMLNGDSSYLSGVALPMLFIGSGVGLSMSPLTNLGISDVDNNDAGVASGLVNVAHQIGGALGLSAMVSASNDITDMAERFHSAMYLAIACIIAALCLSLSTRYKYGKHKLGLYLKHSNNKNKPTNV